MQFGQIIFIRATKPPMKDNVKVINELKQLVGIGDIELIISKLETLFDPSSPDYDVLQVVKARNISIKDENIRGVLPYAEYSMHRSKILTSLLDLINRVPVDKVSKGKGKTEKGPELVVHGNQGFVNSGGEGNTYNQILNHSTSGRKLLAEEKSSLISLIKSKFSEMGGDFYKNIIYVLNPVGNNSPDEISVAADIRDFLRKEGCNVQTATYQLFGPDTGKTDINYKGGTDPMVIVVRLPHNN